MIIKKLITLSLPKGDRLTMIAFALGSFAKCHR